MEVEPNDLERQHQLLLGIRQAHSHELRILHVFERIFEANVPANQYLAQPIPEEPSYFISRIMLHNQDMADLIGPHSFSASHPNLPSTISGWMALADAKPNFTFIRVNVTDPSQQIIDFDMGLFAGFKWDIAPGTKAVPFTGIDPVFFNKIIIMHDELESYRSNRTLSCLREDLLVNESISLRSPNYIP